uniref:mRNA interferase HicA n=1 Tax=Candidatus Kentrum sp. FW TaxID=2126338 RepID=A0A450T1F9_9GAMM|nr:MAG: hypothetical protein BECKFW1821B_GA0114236_105513 [Candidatus Kentron sp. FW]
MNSREFKRWLAHQGVTFESGKGGRLKVRLNSHQSVLPMHSAELKKGMASGRRMLAGETGMLRNHGIVCPVSGYLP